MEEKKFDKNSIIGITLIVLIFVWMMINSQKDAQKEQALKAKQEKIDKAKKELEAKTKQVTTTIADTTVSDTVKIQKLQGTLGSFAYSATLPTAKEGFTVRVRYERAKKPGAAAAIAATLVLVLGAFFVTRRSS